MSNKNTPEDMERTVRLDTQKIMDPYGNPTPPSVDSIEDILSAAEFSDTPDISFEDPEEIIVSPQENIDFDNLTKEMNELSHEFEFNALEEKEEVPVTAPENKPIEKNVPIAEDKPKEATVAVTEDKSEKENSTEKLSNTNTKETSPKVSEPKAKQGTTSTSEIPPVDKKDVKKKKEPAPISATKKINPTANKPSNGITTAMLFISLIALAAGFTGAWSSMSSQSQIDTLTAQLNTLQNNPLNNQPDLSAIQTQLTSLKQALASLKMKHETPPLMKHEAVNIIKLTKKLSPAVITPITPVQEMKPTLPKNTWNVIISSHDSMKKAKKEQQRETIKGMKTSVVAVVVKGKNWYRIVATGFADKQKAISFTHKLKQHGISDAWIQYNK